MQNQHVPSTQRMRRVRLLILQRTGDPLRPGEERRSPPGQELLGVVTSHGPSRESYTPAQKASCWPAETQAAAAAMSAQRLRAAFSPAAIVPALLRRGLPEGGTQVVAVEGAATLPGIGGGPRETKRPKSALPGAR